MKQRSIDPVAVLEALGCGGSLLATPVLGGADTAIWRVERGGEVWALRLFRPEQREVAAREVMVMTAAEATLPVPRVIVAGSWQERPALLLSWMPGQPLAEALAERPWRAWPLGVAFGRTQAAIHRLPAPESLGAQTRSWIEWADPDDALRDRLLAEASLSDVLLHLDYHPANVLTEKGRISAVLDWANALPGDPRADLARTAAILRFAPLPGRFPATLERAACRLFIAGWRHGYRGEMGPLTGMAPFYAWAGRVMVRDLSPRLGRSDLPWLTPELLAEMREWADGVGKTARRRDGE